MGPGYMDWWDRATWTSTTTLGTTPLGTPTCPATVPGMLYHPCLHAVPDGFHSRVCLDVYWIPIYQLTVLNMTSDYPYFILNMRQP